MTEETDTPKHTQGPWQLIGTDPSAGWDGFDILAMPNPALRGFTKHIAAVDGCQHDPERDANARLIAAAPDLLDALREAVDRVDDLVAALGKGFTTVEDLAAWSDDARAAIAKAEGRS